jgi:protein-disulfide isomerase
VSQAEGDEGDLTRKQRRDQARAQRKAAEEAAAAGEARRRRLTQLGGAVVVVIVAVVVILIATGGGGKAEQHKSLKESPTVAKEVDAELNGIPQKELVLGKETAPVTLVYYGDLECPFCREFTLNALPTLVQKDVRAGTLRVEYRNLETATHEPETFHTQQSAAMAAGKQNKAWYYIELFYHLQQEENSGYVNETFLQKLAEETPGLNLSTWQADRGDSAFQAKIATDAQEANNLGLTGTPSFLLGRTGGALKKFEDNNFTEASSFEGEINKLAKA